MRQGTPPEIQVKDPKSITDLGEFLESFAGSTKSLVSAERSYITFLATKRIAEAVRTVAGSVIGFVCYGLAVLIASLGLAIWLGREWDNVLLGFLCVAGGYVLIGMIFGALWKGAVGKRFIVSLINGSYGH